MGLESGSIAIILDDQNYNSLQVFLLVFFVQVVIFMWTSDAHL